MGGKEFVHGQILLKCILEYISLSIEELKLSDRQSLLWLISFRFWRANSVARAFIWCTDKLDTLAFEEGSREPMLPRHSKLITTTFAPLSLGLKTTTALLSRRKQRQFVSSSSIRSPNGLSQRSSVASMLSEKCTFSSAFPIA